jgi:hypothetical protein
MSDNLRIIIHASDIAKICGIGIRTAQRRLKNVRFLLGKSDSADVTIKEFCSVNELNEEEVRKQIDEIDKKKMRYKF